MPHVMPRESAPPHARSAARMHAATRMYAPPLLLSVASDLIFDAEIDLKRAREALGIEDDGVLKNTFEKQCDELRRWMVRWGLTHPSTRADWLALVVHNVTVRDAGPDISHNFDQQFPSLHRHLSTHVDTNPHSDFMEESTFIVVRALIGPNETGAKFDCIIRFRQNELAPILEQCRLMGREKPKDGSSNTDSDTHDKARLFALLVLRHSSENYSPIVMKSAPRHKVELRSRPLRESDRERSRTQLTKMKEDAKSFKRTPMTLAQLNRAASEIKLAFLLIETPVVNFENA